jgi:hypothetical protein
MQCLLLDAGVDRSGRIEMRLAYACLAVVLVLGAGVVLAGDHLSNGPHHGDKIAGTGPDEFEFISDGDTIDWWDGNSYEWDEELELYVASDGSTIEFNAAGGGYQHSAVPTNPYYPGSAGSYGSA